MRRKTAVTLFINCYNKGFTPYWQKADIIKQQLKTARGWQREEQAILKITGGIPSGPPADRIHLVY